MMSYKTYINKNIFKANEKITWMITVKKLVVHALSLSLSLSLFVLTAIFQVKMG